MMQGYTPLARALALAALALSSVVAAFATMAPEIPAPGQVGTTIEPVDLRAGDSLLPAPDAFLREERFLRGDTLAGVLGRLGVAGAEAQKLVRTPALRLLRPGHTLAAQVGAQGELMRLSYLSGRGTLTTVERAGDAFRVMEGAAPLRVEQLMRTGVISSSLFVAADAAGVPDSVAVQIADIFAGDIDFDRELRQGDRFAVVFEQYYLDGRPVHAGRVLAAEFTTRGRTLRALQHASVQGGSGYYAPDGGNLRKAFLRSPLEYTRISSGFGMRRHPFQRSWRAHSGVDFAAPTGTRVRAAGDGVVEFAGPKAGYGNMVVVRHRGQYSTVYAHLSRFAPGAQRGARLAQGDVVGFVGQTGWATGPHLHYEFRVGGQSRNPYAIAMPSGEPVPAAELAAFRRHAEPLLTRLELLAANPIAQLE
jgi:murein DD-endopeptidase MepM/ murein hydrolase activator NlpD